MHDRGTRLETGDAPGLGAESADLPDLPSNGGFIDAAAAPRRRDIAGAVDGLLGGTVIGWAYDRDLPRRRVKIALLVDGAVVAETMANGLRRELAGPGGHDGFSGFACAIPPGKFTPGTALRVLADGIALGDMMRLGPERIDGIFEPLRGAVGGGWVRERVQEPTRAVLDMLVDGRVARIVIADRPREELRRHGVGDGCFGFADSLPSVCLDGGEHWIEFRHRASGIVLAPGARCFQASFAGAVERLDQHGGSGWVYCREAPERPLSLDIAVNGERLAIIADGPRPDLRAAGAPLYCGFAFSLSDTVPRHGEITAEIFAAGTDNPVIPGQFRFTPVSCLIEHLEAIAAQADAGNDSGGARKLSPLRDTIIPKIIAGLRAPGPQAATIDLAPSLDPARLQSPAAPVADIVDIVIPVYSGRDETVACLDSAIRAINTTEREIVVVDDCGPDPTLRAALAAYAKSGAITLLTNPANLGFPGAANAGMALHPDRDVILLNADTLVPDGWVDRLRERAYRAGNIGTVTPFSNRATICSYPESNTDNDLPADMPWQELDRLCAEANHGTAVEIPTAVGFCAYLRRAMLREVGLLNTERWRRGYGEENELCILAAARGWKHVLAPDLFVVHHGAVSFGEDGRKAQLAGNMATLNRFYPDYFPRVMQFIRDDPVAASRRALDWARLKRLGERFMLLVSHRHGGGTAVHVEDMARRLAAQGQTALILEANSDRDGVAVVRNLALGTVSHYALPREAETLIADLRACGVWHVHFHQIMGGERWAALPAQLGCAWDVTIHDYAAFCPRIDLIDENNHYCGEPDFATCERCIAVNRPHPQLAGAFRDQGGLDQWLRLHGALLAGARRVFVPTGDVAARMERHIPGVRYEVRHHPEARRTVTIRRPASPAAARVAVIGALGPNKGCDLLPGCARDALKRDLPLQFYLFGFTADPAPLRDLGNVRLLGGYARPDLPALLAANPCDAALFLSIWPETHCYALSEAYAAGLYPIALGFGALGERIAASKVGTLLPPASTPAEINAGVLAALDDAAHWPRSVEVGEEYPDIFADYYKF